MNGKGNFTVEVLKGFGSLSVRSIICSWLSCALVS